MKTSIIITIKVSSMNFLLFVLFLVSHSIHCDTVHLTATNSLKLEIHCQHYHITLKSTSKNCWTPEYPVTINSQTRVSSELCSYQCDGEYQGSVIITQKQAQKDTLHAEIRFKDEILHFFDNNLYENYGLLPLSLQRNKEAFHTVRNAVLPIGIFIHDYISLIQAQSYIELVLPSVNKIYKQDFNFELRISEIRIGERWAKCNQESEDFYTSLQTDLPKFMSRRAHQWVMLTNCSVGSIVGKSYVNVVGKTPSVAYVLIEQSFMTLAHEFGHALGAGHDEHSKSVMYKSAVRLEPQFSPQSMLEISNNLKENETPFLIELQDFKNQQNRFENLPKTCGNGIVDPGEECDAGNQCFLNKCCDCTCKLRPQKQCASGVCCENCMFKRGNVCHGKKGDCDYESFCSGTSSLCHVRTKPDKQSCINGTNSGTCYLGTCVSRDEQCREAGIKDAKLSGCEKICFVPEKNILAKFPESFEDGSICGSNICMKGRCVSDKQRIHRRSLEPIALEIIDPIDFSTLIRNQANLRIFLYFALTTWILAAIFNFSMTFFYVNKFCPF